MNLYNLTNAQLENSFKIVVQNERKILFAVITHLQEIEKRKSYIEKGYTSLFDYLVKEMKYSSSAAQRRIEASRLAKEIPLVSEKIKSGELNLSQIGELQSAAKKFANLHKIKVTTKQKEEILNKFKTGESAQQICAEELNLPIIQHDKVTHQKDGSVRMEITLTKAQYEKLNQASGRLAQKQFNNQSDFSLASKIEAITDQVLTTHPVADAAVKWKSLSPKRKANILTGQCEYEHNGKRCGSVFQLEVDHIQPKHAGGSNERENLRPFCRVHNQYRYRNAVSRVSARYPLCGIGVEGLR